jgi:hypothetical protein
MRIELKNIRKSEFHHVIITFISKSKDIHWWPRAEPTRDKKRLHKTSQSDVLNAIQIAWRGLKGF